ncbi:MAG: hypothetical protein DI538_04780 [Azospira oryzae]|nr:MAG: hypothetical protein DI538_04780 [Azospira oryzae]
MAIGKDYLREIQKFTTSQYWNTGVRITAGVLVPTFFLLQNDWLGQGMPFLWGALFVSLTDSPGPIHHRRNGMLAAIAFNTFTAILIGLGRGHEPILISLVVAFSFFYSLLGVYGARAGAVGTLALVIMLINLVPYHDHHHFLLDSALITGGGLWYMLFSLLLYRIRPYRLVEQAIGENLIAMADYVRARGGFYKPEANMKESFNKLMEEQVRVLRIQDQTRELIFKTRQFVIDPSPKSRSLMMIFLDSVDLLEQTLSSYQDYSQLQQNLRESELLKKFYEAVMELAAELEYIGISIQSGRAIYSQLDLSPVIRDLGFMIADYRHNAKDNSSYPSLDALQKTLFNMNNISKRMHRLVLYSRLEVELDKENPATLEINKNVASQSIEWQVIKENFSLKSNHFRYAIRLTAAMLTGYAVSILFSLGHTYWVLLTIVTILKPVYAVSRKRNIHRLAGTLTGALVAILLIYFITNTTALVVILVICMIMGYSLLRINYFGFVLFLTIYIIITFHFLNPMEFRTLIEQRLVDTLVGSVIAGIAARFIFPVWGTAEMESSMKEMLAANHTYFIAASKQLQNKVTDTHQYKLARKEAMVALTNLSDNFQQMLSEPQPSKGSIPIHQFVIASHMLNGHIAALTTEKYSIDTVTSDSWTQLTDAIQQEFDVAEKQLASGAGPVKKEEEPKSFPTSQTLTQLSMIYMLVRDIRIITDKK